MTDLKLYRLRDGRAEALPASQSRLERDLQRTLEANMELLFGVRLLASEYSTGVVHGGRMDSIGLDENGTPVIFEYKRSVGETVINQGLFYLDWLLDHQGDFKLLVMERLGKEAADQVDFSSPRLVCVANDFTRYDEYAIRQMGRAIELMRYQLFDDDLLALELVASSQGRPTSRPATGALSSAPTKEPRYTTVLEHLAKAPQELRDLYDEVVVVMEGLGDDVTIKVTKYYVAFRRIKNFASVEVYTQKRKLQVFLKLDPTSVILEEGFTRDVTNIGHLGTGNLELTISNADDLTKALPLIQASYEAN